MRSRAVRAGRIAVLVLAALGAGALAGCGSPGGGAGGGVDPAGVAERMRRVAVAWDGSSAAELWREGYHPTGDVVQLPRGGLRGQTDRQAYQDRSFVLRGTLPAGAPESGRVVWAGKRGLSRPAQEADQAYEALSGGRAGTGPRLTVTGAKLGDMTLATSRGPAVVPAWLFTLEGYDTPLKRAAVAASALPRPPVGEARDLPVLALEHLSRVSQDGRSVTVGGYRGDCDDGPAVDVLETRGSVVLSASASVRKRRSEGLCTKAARLREVTVRLDRALGERVLLDSYTGRPVPYRPPNGPSPTWSWRSGPARSAHLTFRQNGTCSTLPDHGHRNHA